MTSEVRLCRTQASAAVPRWRVLLGRLEVAYSFPSFPEAIGFVTEVAELAEAQQHHPEIDIRYSTVFLATSSHDVGGLTRRDVRLANAISDLAERFGATAQPHKLTTDEIAIDTMDASVIQPFWQAVLAYHVDGDDALVDPYRRGPAVWFQQLDEPRRVRNRIHLDVTVTPEEAQVRMERALAAGGRLVSAAAAPSFWVLADADGNEACLCTWQGRDESKAAAEAEAQAI
ncbi:MAG TPA: 4a-hydroxytetrahydrobiopterin dehydratase [Propionibacteriaceae bacterium]|nr:4a-hydroxytetrahydrobiopterin dehydratase [Propionibacteriaceae bacterium]